MTNPLAIVTGASRGIGKAIALQLLAKGYTVVGFYKAKGKLGKPEDVAALAMQVVDDKSVNGQLVFDKRVSL